MHPSVLAKESADRPRRVARKRERRASCSAAPQSLQTSYPIPSLQPKMERRRSGSSESPRSHSKIERRSSGSSGSPKSHSKTERRSSGSSRSPRLLTKMESRSSGSSESLKSHSKMERRSSGTASSSNGIPVSSNPRMEIRLSNSSHPRMERRLSNSSHPRMEGRLSGSSFLPFGNSLPKQTMMPRRSSCGPAPYTSPAGLSISCHTRMQRRDSCASTTSLSDSFNSASSVKSCSFREQPEIRHVPAATSMVDDPSDLWFQKEDFQNFREKTRRIISNVDENGRGKNGKKYCTRGLEKYTAAASIKRKNIRRSILLALEDGDSSSLEDLSESCVTEARQLGVTNAIEANSICKRIYPFRRASVQ